MPNSRRPRMSRSLDFRRDARPAPRRLSSANERAYRSPANVRVNNSEFLQYAKRLATLKAALLAQREMMHIYERRWKKSVNATIKAQDRLCWMYPDDDELRSLMQSIATAAGANKGRLEALQSGTMEKSYKYMEEQYRRYLAEVGSIEKEFRFAEELQARLTRQDRVLARFQTSRRVDARRVEQLESEIDYTKLSFDRMVERTIERMKVTEEKFDRVFHAGHVAVWKGFRGHLDLAKEENAQMFEWAQMVAGDLADVEVAELTADNAPVVDLPTVGEEAATRESGVVAAPNQPVRGATTAIEQRIQEDSGDHSEDRAIRKNSKPLTPASPITPAEPEPIAAA